MSRFFTRRTCTLAAAAIISVCSAHAHAQSSSVTFNKKSDKGSASLTISRGLNRSQSSLTYMTTGRTYGYEDEMAGQYGRRIKAGNTTDASKRGAFERGYQEGVAKARAERDGTVTVTDPAEQKRNTLIFNVMAGVIATGVLGSALVRRLK